MKRPPKITKVGDLTVDCWYDRSSRNWICQLKDREWNEIVAEFSGSADGAVSSWKRMVVEATNLQV